MMSQCHCPRCHCLQWRLWVGIPFLSKKMKTSFWKKMPKVQWSTPRSTLESQRTTVQQRRTSYFLTQPVEKVVIQGPGSHQVDNFRGGRQYFFQIVGRVWRGCMLIQIVMSHNDVWNVFTKAAKPDVLPSITSVPSVRKTLRFFFQSTFCLARKLFTILKTSMACIVSKRSSQNRNYSDSVNLQKNDENQELGALRNVSHFLQLHAEGKWGRYTISVFFLFSTPQVSSSISGQKVSPLCLTSFDWQCDKELCPKLQDTAFVTGQIQLLVKFLTLKSDPLSHEKTPYYWFFPPG